MNLRKLLCGLLALCLLLTMAPVALMEGLEAPVGEVEIEIGEAAPVELEADVIEAEDYLAATAVTIVNEDGKAAPTSADVKDGTITLMATLTPATAEDQYVLWKTSNAAVAAIDGEDAKGGPNVPITITLKKKGTAKITATVPSGKSATLKLKVTDEYAPTSVSLSSATKSVGIGEELEINATINNVYYRKYAGDLTWTIDKKSILTFDDGTVKTVTTEDDVEKGKEPVKVVGVAEGKAKVTATTRNGKKASVTITVTDPAKPDSMQLVDVESKFSAKFGAGKTETMELYDEAESTPEEPVKVSGLVVGVDLYKGTGKNATKIEYDEDDAGIYAQYAGITWKSSKTSVATVSRDPDNPGKAFIDLKGTGSAKITTKSKDGKKSVSFTIKVVNSHAVEKVYLFTKTYTKIKVGETVDLSENYVLISKSGEPYATAKLTAHHPSMVEVDGDAFTATPTKKGTIKLDIEAGGKKATVTIKAIN